ncbi:hypothetical protein CB0940_00316 [Cercospora beticola]|uniref:Prolyl 4-hydroxylase alpha subunit Fe(2+) 2OG dioxygenase domain-containing protein n=1 Tax=Cercospora beticola TaxID=122368 RepID=A0A2G5ICP1_CERBT|nr:hypothetical protein CB0940_00316 [Cercospora beticola]PIB02520.1 hypothetical protein CB0940_00316 [Cercospora beticola]WPA95727.1 hypothetical protein RHO25_000330 [Cercospora beticola]
MEEPAIAEEAIRLPEERPEEADPKEVEVPQQDKFGDVENSDSEVGCTSNSWKLKQNLLSALQKIQPSGSFAHSAGLANQFIDPIIWIPDNQPPITLPVHEVEAKRLIACSHQAPFGKGSETIIDQNVRRTWELNHDQFRVCNPAFNDTVMSPVLVNVADELGVPKGTTISAQLYKLLIYERGAMFRAHTDTEKVPGMFGTLVICLPSAHEGGDLVLTHRGSTKRFSTSREQPCYACWYSDVQHEVQEVTSGYRIVLTYNLVQTENPVRNLSALGMERDYSELKRPLKSWSASETGAVVHILEHKYTDVSLRLSAMKGADHSRVMALQRFAGKYNYNIFLGSMEHEMSGSAEDDYDRYDFHGRRYGRGGWHEDCDSSDDGYHAIDEVIDERTTLNRVVLPDEAGTEILTDVDFDHDELLWDEAFTGVREPDEHDYEGYTGNAGAQATHWYRDTVVILVPGKRTVQWCLKSYSKGSSGRGDILPLRTWLKTRCNQQSSNEDIEQAKSDLCEACIYVTQQNTETIFGRPAFPADIYNEAVKILLQLGNYDGLVAAVASSADQKSSAAFATLAPLISDRFERLAPALTKAFGRFNSIKFMFEALKALFNDQLGGQTGPTADWIKGTVKRAIGGVVEPEEQDGTTLAEITISFRGMSEVIKRRTGNTNFMLAFLAELIRKAHGALPPAEVLVIVKHFMGDVLDGFLPTLLSTGGQKEMKGYNYLVTTVAQASRNTAPNIAELWRYLFQNDMRAEIESFFTAMDRAIMASCTTLLVGVFMPFLKLLQPLAKANLNNDYAPMFRKLYCSIFGACIENYVQKQPPSTQSWARDRLKRSCATCFQVNLYLTSVTQQVGRFSLGKPKAQHVQQQLVSARNIDCTHATKPYTRPLMLVITKRDRAQAAYDTWYARCDSLAKMMGSFELDVLWDVLGRDYVELIGMRSVIHSAEARLPLDVKRPPSKILLPRPNPPRMATVPAAASGPPHAGTKRKIEIVDLLDSD